MPFFLHLNQLFKSIHALAHFAWDGVSKTAMIIIFNQDQGLPLQCVAADFRLNCQDDTDTDTGSSDMYLMSEDQEDPMKLEMKAACLRLPKCMRQLSSLVGFEERTQDWRIQVSGLERVCDYITILACFRSIDPQIDQAFHSFCRQHQIYSDEVLVEWEANGFGVLDLNDPDQRRTFCRIIVISRQALNDVGIGEHWVESHRNSRHISFKMNTDGSIGDGVVYRRHKVAGEERKTVDFAYFELNDPALLRYFSGTNGEPYFGPNMQEDQGFCGGTASQYLKDIWEDSKATYDHAMESLAPEPGTSLKMLLVPDDIKGKFYNYLHLVSNGAQPEHVFMFWNRNLVCDGVYYEAGSSAADMIKLESKYNRACVRLTSRLLATFETTTKHNNRYQGNTGTYASTIIFILQDRRCPIPRLQAQLMELGRARGYPVDIAAYQQTVFIGKIAQFGSLQQPVFPNTVCRTRGGATNEDDDTCLAEMLLNQCKFHDIFGLTRYGGPLLRKAIASAKAIGLAFPKKKPLRPPVDLPSDEILHSKFGASKFQTTNGHQYGTMSLYFWGPTQKLKSGERLCSYCGTPTCICCNTCSFKMGVCLACQPQHHGEVSFEKWDDDRELHCIRMVTSQTRCSQCQSPAFSVWNTNDNPFQEIPLCFDCISGAYEPGWHMIRQVEDPQNVPCSNSPEEGGDGCYGDGRALSVWVHSGNPNNEYNLCFGCICEEGLGEEEYSVKPEPRVPSDWEAPKTPREAFKAWCIGTEGCPALGTLTLWDFKNVVLYYKARKCFKTCRRVASFVEMHGGELETPQDEEAVEACFRRAADSSDGKKFKVDKIALRTFLDKTNGYFASVPEPRRQTPVVKTTHCWKSMKQQMCKLAQLASALLLYRY